MLNSIVIIDTVKNTHILCVKRLFTLETTRLISEWIFNLTRLPRLKHIEVRFMISWKIRLVSLVVQKQFIDRTAR